MSHGVCIADSHHIGLGTVMKLKLPKFPAIAIPSWQGVAWAENVEGLWRVKTVGRAAWLRGP